MATFALHSIMEPFPKDIWKIILKEFNNWTQIARLAVVHKAMLNTILSLAENVNLTATESKKYINAIERCCCIVGLKTLTAIIEPFDLVKILQCTAPQHLYIALKSHTYVRSEVQSLTIMGGSFMHTPIGAEMPNFGGFRYLRHLSFVGSRVEAVNTDAFWTQVAMCHNLEVLYLFDNYYLTLLCKNSQQVQRALTCLPKLRQLGIPPGIVWPMFGHLSPLHIFNLRFKEILPGAAHLSDTLLKAIVWTELPIFNYEARLTGLEVLTNGWIHQLVQMNVPELTDEIEQRILEWVSISCDINEKRQDGATPLILAARGEKLHHFQALLNLGASLTERDVNGLNALLVACQRIKAWVICVDKLKTLQTPLGDSHFVVPSNMRTIWHLTTYSIEAIQLTHKVAVHHFPSLHLDSTDWEGKSPLFYACALDNSEVVEFLLNNGALINRMSHTGVSCLHQACLSKAYRCISVLIRDPELELKPFAKDVSTGRSLLMDAVSCGHLRVVQRLIESIKHEESYLLNEKDYNGRTVIHYAATACRQADDIDILAWLLTQCQYKNIFAVDEKDNAGFTPLMMAVDYPGRLNILLQHGADVNATNAAGNTALRLLLNKGEKYLEFANILVRYGADATIPSHDDGFSPLTFASARHTSRMLQHLLKAYKIENRYIDADTPDEHDRTALMLCALHMQDYDDELVRWLLELGADVNARLPNNDGTALHLLAKRGMWTDTIFGHPDADFTAVNKSGNTVLHEAVLSGEPLAVYHALAFGKSSADINARNKVGQTPLHLAVKKGVASIVQLLLDWNADVGVKDAHQNTPLDLARKLNNTKSSDSAKIYELLCEVTESRGV